MAIDFDNAQTATRFEHVSLKNADKTPARCKRNGKTKIWITRPGLFRIPVKHGLRDCFYIDNFDLKNAGDWNIVQ